MGEHLKKLLDSPSKENLEMIKKEIGRIGEIIEAMRSIVDSITSPIERKKTELNIEEEQKKLERYMEARDKIQEKINKET